MSGDAAAVRPADDAAVERASAESSAATSPFFRPTPTMWLYLAGAAVAYASGVLYAWSNGLSLKALFLCGLL